MNQLSLKQELHLNVSLSLNQQLSLSMLKMNFVELYEFLTKEFENNPALEGELPSFGGFSNNEMALGHTKTTLKEELLFQIHTIKPSPDLVLCEYIIDNIDERGYLTLSVEEISKELNTPAHLIEESKKVIQGLEPIGVGACELKECLLIQLEKLYPHALAAKSLVRDHLSDLLHKKFELLEVKTSFSLEESKEAFEYIKTLNPVPGNGWASEYDIKFIRPDLLLFDDEDGFKIEMPKQGFDKIIINPYYIEQLTLPTDKNQEAIKRDLSRAKAVLKGLGNRDHTLFRIAKVMTDRQKEYLKWGKPLCSLRLSDIANKLDVHESTVSRGVDGKYMLYHDQMIELGSLLSKKSASGTSVDQVKQRLLWIIQKENKQSPLTDPQLMEELKEYGLDISRRTVSKYRQELGVASANQRKNQ